MKFDGLYLVIILLVIAIIVVTVSSEKAYNKRQAAIVVQCHELYTSARTHSDTLIVNTQQVSAHSTCYDFSKVER